MKIQQRMVESDRGVRAENFCVCILAKTEEATTSVYDIWFYSGWNHPHSHKSLRSIQLRLSNCCQQIPPLASIAWISRPAEPATPPSPIPSPRWNNQPPQIFAHPRTPNVGKKKCSTRTNLRVRPTWAMTTFIISESTLHDLQKSYPCRDAWISKESQKQHMPWNARHSKPTPKTIKSRP